MINYIIRRLLLLPITLFFIILVTFVIINLAPGDPVTVTEISPEGAASRKADRATAFGLDERYLQFREFYGLTLPILFNNWPSITKKSVEKTLWQLVNRRENVDSKEEMNFKKYSQLRVSFGDKSRFIMPKLIQIAEDPKFPLPMRRMAAAFFIRGGTRQGFIGPNLSAEKKQLNKKIAQDNQRLTSLSISEADTSSQMNEKLKKLREWYEENKEFYRFTPSSKEKIKIFFFETRFYRYMSRVLRLDFGTLRNDSNKTVISEVTRRFKYSLTLSILPMFITTIFCVSFGFLMALKQNQWQDYSLNIFFLILYAIPIFVVAPFLIENVALNHHFPLTNTPIPISGFTSPDRVYNKQVSYQRLLDILQHIFLPLVAILYGSLAAQARLSRTAVLEVLRQDYVRTAKAKGVPPLTIMFKHVGRNASITIVTSIAGSLGIVLGGSLIVEILFGINGFGKFFYEAVINRDYNVIMFSTLAGSFLTLLGYLLADITYTLLDPRLTLE